MLLTTVRCLNPVETKVLDLSWLIVEGLNEFGKLIQRRRRKYGRRPSSFLELHQQMRFSVCSTGDGGVSSNLGLDL